MANAGAQSEYRTKRSNARSKFQRTRLDAQYAPAFTAWKGGVDTFLKAF